MTERTLLWTVTDPRGLSISLAADVWAMIVRKHQDMQPYLAAVRQTVESPDEIYFDAESTQARHTGAQMFVYRRDHLLSQADADKHVLVAVKVLVEDNGERGYVQTAYASDRVAKRWVSRWKK